MLRVSCITFLPLRREHRVSTIAINARKETRASRLYDNHDKFHNMTKS
ncbi:MAG: hypothetical protein VSS75_022440 [Candidatus Parabeggiatoa sp.]|nr:hypothetical protein [Candidatus Parabeggiatoa sp.]